MAVRSVMANHPGALLAAGSSMLICEVFAAVATASSLSGAARRLWLSAMTVSRRLASLEKELRVRLVQRTTRSASLTPEGEVLLPCARSMLKANEAARATLKRMQERPVVY